MLVCLPGGTYSREYWDLNGVARGYSFAEFATENGYAVVTIDPLGTGESSKPVRDFDFADIAATLAAAVAALPGAIGDHVDRPWPSRIRWVGIWRSPSKRCFPATPGWRSSDVPINTSHR